MKKEKNQEKSIKNFILESEFFAKKSLGQNFLIDQNIIKKIANFLLKSSFENEDIYSNTFNSESINSSSLNSTSSSSNSLSPSYCSNNPNYILEIGAGPGILTKEIAKQFPNSTIFAVEKDDRFIKNLETISNVHVIHNDALKCDWDEIAQQMKKIRNTENLFDTEINTQLDEQLNSQFYTQSKLQTNTQHRIDDFITQSSHAHSQYSHVSSSPDSHSSNLSNLDQPQSSFKSHSIHKENKKISVIGNLPYNVSVPILFSLLDKKHLFDQFIFMFQKEVANRIIAKTNNSNYGKLSIMTQIHSIPNKILHVPPSVFWPQPKIDSEIVRFKIKNDFIHNHDRDGENEEIQNKKLQSRVLYAEKLDSVDIQKNELGKAQDKPEKKYMLGETLENAIGYKNCSKNSNENKVITDPQNTEIQNANIQTVFLTAELHKEIEKLTFIAFQQRRKTFQSIFRNAVKNKHYNESDFKGYDSVNFSEHDAVVHYCECDALNYCKNKEYINVDRSNRTMNIHVSNTNLNRVQSNPTISQYHKVDKLNNKNTYNLQDYKPNILCNKSTNKFLPFYEKIFMKLQLDIKHRPENFSPQEFCKIAMELLQLRKK